MLTYFGHVILECISRLWHVVESGAAERIAFLPVDCDNLSAIKIMYSPVFELLGIDLKKVIYIEEPTQFDRVIVPDETIMAWGEDAYYKEKYTVLYEKIMSGVEAKDAKKIYLTRTQLESHDCLNEEYFEEFYRRRGFKVIAPEQLSIKEQIAYMKGAEEVACNLGTLSHQLLFSRPGTRLTALIRKEGILLRPQLIVNQAKELDFYVVDVSLNLLPSVHHVTHCFLLGPSKYWKEYLAAAGESYSKEELDWNMGAFLYEYLTKWTTNVSSLAGWSRGLAAFDNFDFLNSLSTSLLDKPLKREDYPGSFKEREAALAAEVERLKGNIADPDAARFEAQIAQLQAENKALASDVRRLECKLQSMRNSLVWKIRGPLKKVWSLLGGRTRTKLAAALRKRLK